jgi:hypothetical protein
MTPGSAVPATTVFMQTASDFDAGDEDPAKVEECLDRRMQEHTMLAYLTFDAAADAASMANSEELDPDAWTALLAAVYGTVPDARGEIATSTRPNMLSFIHRAELDGDIKIDVADTADRDANLEYRDEHPETDALLLPNTDDTPLDGCLRMIPSRSLLGHFTVKSTNAVGPRSRPRS